MDFFVRKILDKSEHEKIISFLSSLNYYCIEQHPDWDFDNKGSVKIFFLCTDENKIVRSYANILISKGIFKIAKINFGPAFSDYEILTKSIIFLHDFFLAQGFIYFSIQLGIFINKETELLEYVINHNFKVKYYFKPGNLWSSLFIDLTQSETEILKSFSKGHRSTIKHAYKTNRLRTSIEKDNANLSAFINLYIKMLGFRKIAFSKEDIINFFNGILNFLFKYDKGFIEYVYDADIVVGGVIIIYQGKSARYFKSASDPERRDIPVMHLGLFDAIKFCKTEGFSTFDLWGYNHFVDDKEQIFYINKFKKGFSRNFTFYPKRMHFELRPFKYKIFLCLKFIKKVIYDFRM